MFRAGFETIGAVLRGGFGLGRGLRGKSGRKIYFVGRYFAPTWGKRPEYERNLTIFLKRNAILVLNFNMKYWLLVAPVWSLVYNGKKRSDKSGR